MSLQVEMDKMLEMFEAGQCKSSYQMGFLIGRRFLDMIRSRLLKDPILRDQLLPWARTRESLLLIEALTRSNREKFLEHWDKLIGTAEGSAAPFLEVCFSSFRSLGKKDNFPGK